MNYSLQVQSKNNFSMPHGNLSTVNSSLILEFGDCGEHWVDYIVRFCSSSQTIEFNGVALKLCLDPENELLKLSQKLKRFLESTRTVFRFETIEPSLEIQIDRIHRTVLHGDNSGDIYKLYCWIDHGNREYNACHTHYSWDAFGIRMFCDDVELRRFATECSALANIYSV